MSKEITLTKGRSAIVDAADFDWLNQWKWCCNSRGYVMRKAPRKKGKRKTIRMHRVILSPPGDMEVDHINGNPLDNRRCNLRICTHTQNLANSRKRAGCSSRYKGVWWDSNRRKWQAYIRSASKRIHLGRFNTEEAAAAAYDQAALEYFGEFARLNNPRAVPA